MKPVVLSLGVLLLGIVSGWCSEKPKLNVLMIAVDDLRPELGCYGSPVARTPATDRLAEQGTVFLRAYCQQAVCSPSRTSLLLGRRPDTTKIYELQTHFRKYLPEVVTLPQHFKQHGYHTQGLSKIYHGGLDDPHSWSTPHWTPPGPGYGKAETLAALRQEQEELRKKFKGPAIEVLERDPKTGMPLKVSPARYRVRGPAWEAPDVPDDALPDGKTTAQALEVLQQLKDKPFFLAVGYLKPHLPFVAPKRYFDLYKREQLRLPSNPFPPKDVPALALTNWSELRGYKDIPAEGPLPEQTALDLIHAYYASVSYIDAQVGRLLEELERLGLREKTIVVLWGDHGWHLGEHGLWCKHTNFEVATRSPLVISAPAQKKPGAKCNALVEFVDIYPTLCQLCNLPIPDGLEGTSMAPLLDEPDRQWKTAAFSQYPRGRVMGYSMRTERYRYTEWRDPKSELPVAVELYDYQTDPHGDVNLAGTPQAAKLVEELGRQLKAGWQQARPPSPTVPAVENPR